jgi:hypothetical protein
MARFDWVEFYGEFAKTLLQYKNNRQAIIDNIIAVYNEAGINLPTLEKDNNIIDGYLTKGKIPIFKWKVWALIIVFTLSEILIFPYAIGAFVNYVKNSKLINKLDEIMLEKNYIKLEEVEE